MNRYIITLSEQTEESGRVQGALARFGQVLGSTDQARAQGDVREYTYLKALGIIIALLTDAEAEELAQMKAVTAIEQDGEEHILGVLEPSPPIRHNSTALWNMQLVRADVVWPTGRFGDGVKVAVIDTGIAPHHNLQVYGGRSFVAGVGSYEDDNGHGTHCAGIIAGKGRNNVFGVAPGAYLYAVKTLNAAGSGYTSDIISGMNWCVENGMNVISMSLGGKRGPDAAYIKAIKRCHQNNVVVVCAAGNSFTSTFPWVNAPANSIDAADQYATPLAVASVNSQKVVAGSSSRGGQVALWNQVTVSAPGVSIYSTHLNYGYVFMSGTSMACPHVAGLAALIVKEYAGISPVGVLAVMATNASPLGTSPPNEPYGFGLIDCASALGVVRTRTTMELEPA